LKIKIKIIASILAVSLLLSPMLIFSSCKKSYRQRSVTLFDYFNTFSVLTVYTNDDSELEKYAKIFEDTLSLYHELLDANESYDGVVNICYLNENAAREPIKVSDEMVDFLSFAKQMHRLTDGYTSIALGSVTFLWKNALESETLPDENELGEALKHTDIDSLIINEDTGEVSFSDNGLRLDAGALAKGYASKILYDRLIETDCESFLINLGGNITAHGQKQDGSSWLGGIENPVQTKEISDMSIDISERSISTSGSYNQFFTLDEKKYHHIINPRTAYPENEFISVSVVTSDISAADALSTALFSMKLEDGLELVKSLENTEAVWITPDGECFSTEGLEQYKNK